MYVTKFLSGLLRGLWSLPQKRQNPDTLRSRMATVWNLVAPRRVTKSHSCSGCVADRCWNFQSPHQFPYIDQWLSLARRPPLWLRSCALHNPTSKALLSQASLSSRPSAPQFLQYCLLKKKKVFLTHFCLLITLLLPQNLP